MIFCKIDVEENSECKLCCKYCKNKCVERCVFDKFNVECSNDLIVAGERAIMNILNDK